MLPLSSAVSGCATVALAVWNRLSRSTEWKNTPQQNRQKSAGRLAANMARHIFLVLALFIATLNIFVTVKCLNLDKTLHIYEDSAQKQQNRRTIVINAGDEIPSYHDRQKRSTAPTNSTTTANQSISVKVYILCLIIRIFYFFTARFCYDVASNKVMWQWHLFSNICCLF